MYTNWQSRENAAHEAREFVRKHSFGTLSTINQGLGEFNGYPAGQIEYYIETDNDDASLLLIRVDMSTAFRNVHLGSPSSLAIRAGDEPKAVTPLHMANSHRIILYGNFEDYEPTQSDIRRFFKSHPDAREWCPGKAGFHKTYWTKFEITGIYYIGGFGGEHYIGMIPIEEYRAACSYDYNEKSVLLKNDARSQSWIDYIMSWIWPY